MKKWRTPTAVNSEIQGAQPKDNFCQKPKISYSPKSKNYVVCVQTPPPLREGRGTSSFSRIFPERREGEGLCTQA